MLGIVKKLNSLIGTRIRERPSIDTIEEVLIELEHAPEDPNLWLRYGELLVARGELPKATRAYYKCLSLDLVNVARRRGLESHLDGFIGSGNLMSEVDLVTLKSRNRGIFISSLPKSGTVFIQDSLCTGLRTRPVAFPSGGYFPDVTIPMSAVDRIVNDGQICVVHAPASAQNRIELHYRIDRIVVHIRDLRSSLLSFAHFIGNVIRYADPVQAHHFKIPMNFVDLSLSDRIDILLDVYMPAQVKWVKSWLDAEADPSFFPKILFSTHESLVNNQNLFFDRILDFHNIDKNCFTYPPMPQSGSRNFRRGQTKEWLEAFKSGQLDKANSMIPRYMRERFEWGDA